MNFSFELYPKVPEKRSGNTSIHVKDRRFLNTGVYRIVLTGTYRIDRSKRSQYRSIPDLDNPLC